jgi:hypothetical protein
VLAAAVITALTLVGSTLHVKSLIRERANPAYTHASRIFALAAPIAVYLVPGQWWPVVPFVLLAARALWWHDPSWRPARIGSVELAGLVSVAVTGFLVL